jgi:hypothetical protein
VKARPGPAESNAGPGRLAAMLAISGAGIGSLLLWRSAASGSWLDEYWQMYVSLAPADGTLARRLLADVHPPWFNLAARPLLQASGGLLAPARTASAALALLFLTLGLARLARSDGQSNRAIYGYFWLLVVGMAGPAGLADMATSMRIYPWLIGLSSLQAAILYQLATNRLAARDHWIAVIATTASISLHYVHAVGAIAIALVSIAAAWRRDPPAARMLVGAAALGIMLDIACGLIQLPHWRLHNDVNWIAVSGKTAMSTLRAGITAHLIFNAIAMASIPAGLVVKSNRIVTAWLAAPILIAVVTWTAMDSVIPMIALRYTVSIFVMLALLGAAALASLRPRWLLELAVVSLVVVEFGYYATYLGPIGGWEDGARIISARLRACPSSKVYVASHWQFDAYAASNAAAFESPVELFGQQHLAARFGFRVEAVPAGTSVRPASGVCQTLVWIVQRSDLAMRDPRWTVARAGLVVAVDMPISTTSVENGVILAIGPDARNSSNISGFGARPSE